tara:strand:- start:149 stop:394 length:246 start_codon:yes stop_codon:yes gene_type:complete
MASTESAGGDGNELESKFLAAVERNDVAVAFECLNDGVDVNARNPRDGQTALHVCAWNGYDTILKELLDRNVNLDIRSKGE